MKINKSSKVVIDNIKKKTDNNPDIIFKTKKYGKFELNIIFCESMTDRLTINDYILEFLSKTDQNVKTNNIVEYLTDRLPVTKVSKITTEDELIYSVLSGLTVILINGEEEALAMETRTMLNSDITESKNEKTLKGPKDGFTESYQTNLGLLRKRLKTSDLRVTEHRVGTVGKALVSVVAINNIVNKELLEYVNKKIAEIDIDAVLDVNQIIELISSNEKNIFPNYVATERPDYAANLLLEGRIAIVLENVPEVGIIPVFFKDFFNSPEDHYSRPLNATVNRIIRLFALLITLLTPAIYIAITTFNHESIPSNFLINLTTQRDGTPFTTIIEAILMGISFEILKETDTRAPSPIGSSLSIVGALVLGEAAVTAGIVSPIMVIIIAITAISGLIVSYADVSQAIRIWRFIFMIGATVAGIFGVLLIGIIFVANLSSIKSFGMPFGAPYAPLIPDDAGRAFVLTFFQKYIKRNKLITKNKYKSRER